jgi:3,4-dihydroxy 2-butanone 4-phosphate synthase/GTP cyclohydrolase II
VKGGAIVLCDNEDRENEGDLVFAAEHATPALVNLMIRACGGLICTALSPDLADRFRLAPMARTNACPRGTAFTVSVDAAEGITTGISARDRARTIALLGSPSTRPTDLVAPGHVFPLRARAGGLTERQGHTEAAVALAMAAGLTPAAAICEILDETGEAMRRDALLAFAARHGILIGTVAALAAWQGAAAAPRFAKVTS